MGEGEKGGEKVKKRVMIRDFLRNIIVSEEEKKGRREEGKKGRREEGKKKERKKKNKKKKRKEY